jgi:carboxylesterase
VDTGPLEPAAGQDGASNDPVRPALPDLPDLSVLAPASLPDDPFVLDGARPEACLLVHGSTGTPGDLRGLGEHLHGRGFTVHGIALPGHRRRPARLDGIGWRDCARSVHEAWAALRPGHDRVHVIGFSFGASLTLDLAAREPVDTLTVLAPGLFVQLSARELLGATLGLLPGTWMHARLRWNLGLLSFFRALRGELPRVTCPLLVVHALDDPLVRPESSRVVHESVSSRERRLLLLEEGGHILPWGPAHARVWEAVARHVERRPDA